MKTLFSTAGMAIICSVLLVSCAKEDSNLPQPSTQHTLGAVPTPSDLYNAIPLIQDDGSFRGGTLPTSYSLVMPPVSDQGNIPSCVAFASAYAARSADKFYSTGTAYNTSTNIFSPEYVYNQIKMGDCSGGSRMVDALNLLSNQGVCPWNNMPYSTADGCGILPNSTQVDAAKPNKIRGYSRITATDDLTIKKTIASNKTVMIVMTVYGNFFYAGAGYVYNSTEGGLMGKHALAVCGFDDAKGAYKIMNSWGTAWGESGYSWISYGFFSQVVTEAYSFR
jgi:C1A family cysteine protease